MTSADGMLKLRLSNILEVLSERVLQKNKTERQQFGLIRQNDHLSQNG